MQWFYMPSTPQKLANIIDIGYERLYAMAEPEFQWDREPERVSVTQIKFNYRYLIQHMTNIIEPAYCKVRDLYLRIGADNIGSRIVIALRRYKNEKGNWPESLDDVRDLMPAEIFVDPINDGCFVYKLTDDGFTLYSKGKNNIDEEGQRENEDECGPDDRLIWPQKSRHAEKVDENNEG